MTHELERRAFLSSCAAVVLGLSGCAPLLSRTRLASLELDDPTPDDYTPVLRALIETILPFDHPRFPEIAPAVMEARFLALFPLEADERFLLLRKGLVIFDRIDLFPELAAQTAEEREHAADERARYEQFRAALPRDRAERFTALTPPERSGYLGLWGQSAFASKQLFYHTSRRLVLVTAYSETEFWRAIGYAGPLLPASHRS